VPDLGIFQFQSSEVQLALWERRGAKASATAANLKLARLIHRGLSPIDLSAAAAFTAGNLRVEFQTFINTGECSEELKPVFHELKTWADSEIDDATSLDYFVAAEPLTLSGTKLETLSELVPYITHIHGKFNYMSERQNNPEHFEEKSIDYAGVISALKSGNYSGYINSEYEGQRYFHDLEVEDWMSETDQVVRHQLMLAELIGEQ
jgi:hypothetical protein